MEPSNRSMRPRREAHFRLPAISRREENRGRSMPERSVLSTAALVCFTAPLVFRKARDRSAMTLPRQRSTIRGDSVTEAT